MCSSKAAMTFLLPSVAATKAIGGVLKPDLPGVPKPPPPPPKAPEVNLTKLEAPTGLLAAQTRAARLGTSQLVIPTDSMNIPS